MSTALRFTTILALLVTVVGCDANRSMSTRMSDLPVADPTPPRTLPVITSPKSIPVHTPYSDIAVAAFAENEEPSANNLSGTPTTVRTDSVAVSPPQESVLSEPRRRPPTEIEWKWLEERLGFYQDQAISKPDDDVDVKDVVASPPTK